MPSPLDALGPLPSTLITLDFETFHSKDYNLRKLTTEAYVRDPRFEVIGVGVKVGKAPSVWMEADDFRAWAARQPWFRLAVLAHHAHFDGLVLSHHYGVSPGFWLDTLSMGRALHGEGHGLSLDALAQRYGVGRKGAEVHDFKGYRRRDFTPEEWLRYGVYCNNDVELTEQILRRMLVGFPRAELWLIDTTVRMFSEPRLVGDVAALERTREAERARKAALLERVAVALGVPPGPAEQRQEAARAALASNPQFAAVLQRFGVEPDTKLGKKGETFAFAKSDDFMRDLLESEDETVRQLAEARLDTKSTIVGTRTERMLGVSKRGRVPIYLKYSGAHTHRWSGGDGSNMQNLNRGGSLRAALLASEDERLVVADSGQIEARVLAWLAGQDDTLETFRRNDAKSARYSSEMAARAPRGREPTKEEEKQIARELAGLGIEDGDFYSDRGSAYFGRKLSKKETPVERQSAKSMELGLGYGMGVKAFSLNLLKGFLGAPPVCFGEAERARYGVLLGWFERQNYGRSVWGRELELMWGDGVKLPPGEGDPFERFKVHVAVTAHFVQAYRSANSYVVQLWRKLESAIAVMAAPGSADEVRMRIGPLEIMHQAIRKPSGLVLHYPELRRSTDGWSYLGYKEGRLQRLKLYGGLLTENVVQSLARDVVAEQALWCRVDGTRIVTTTHDEIVGLRRTGEADAALARMIQRMRTPPEWAKGLPLNATGAAARSYGEAK
jgi:DNA polymerase